MTADTGYCAEVLPDLPIRIADGTLTYRIPEPFRDVVRIGTRTLIPLGSRTVRGFVMDVHPCEAIPGREFREIRGVPDSEPLFSRSLASLARWVAGDTLSTLREAVRCVIPPEIPRRRRAARGADTASSTTSALTRESSRSSAPPRPRDSRARTLTAAGASGARPTLLWGETEARLSWIVEAAAATVARGEQVLVVVPEISLTPGLVVRFQAAIGAQVATFHSGLPIRHRRLVWQQVRAGEVDVLVGARSALFAPLDRVGLIVLDEEQDPSFKAEASPRYHAREVALHRGRLEGARVVLGSPAPSLETYAAAISGDLTCLHLAASGPKPRVTVVDMRVAASGTRQGILSQALVEAIRRHLRTGGRVALFVNRIGYARVLLCQECGYAVRCPRCDVAMAYDRETGTVHCRVCGDTALAPEVCPRCRGAALRWVGPGTKRVEEVVRRLFPALRVARVDRETEPAFGTIMTEFSQGRTRLVVGTQLLLRARQLRPSLVGVVDADHPLYFPDFRAAERAFHQLRAMVSLAGPPPGGRAVSGGRVSGDSPPVGTSPDHAPTGPEAVVQTRIPDHPVIAALHTGEEERFYQSELAVRREYGYPPYTHLVRLVASSFDRPAAHALAERAAEIARAQGVEVLGPAPMLRAGGRERFWVQCLLRAPERAAVCGAAREALAGTARRRTARLAVEVDPQEISAW